MKLHALGHRAPFDAKGNEKDATTSFRAQLEREVITKGINTLLVLDMMVWILDTAGDWGLPACHVPPYLLVA